MTRLAVIVLAALLAGALIAAMLDLPPAAVALPEAVSARMGESGVEHPVTAVLLNFRGYDTLLEIAVLLLALVGVQATARRRRERLPAPAAGAVIEMLARLAAPLAVLSAVYLLWCGSHRPGGAFQAGAVFAAGLVLLHLARVLPAWRGPGAGLRVGLGGGFLLFLTVAALLLARGALLEYPPALAGGLILLIESGLTVSLGLILGGLFLLMSGDGGAPS